MQRKVLILAVAALLAVPNIAVATWGGKGDWEPNTKLDRLGGFMFKNPEQNRTGTDGKGHRVYFNGFAGTNGYLAVSTALNPNFATLQSEHQPYAYRPFAILGVWEDCNHDGYIGLADNGVYEYRHELLAGDTSVCQPAALPPLDSRANLPKNTQFPHDDLNWVRELIPIGWDSTFSDAFTPHGRDANPININDSDARVWADWGVPGTPAGGTCYVRPHQRGTWHSPGSIIGYADCFGQGQIGRQIANVTTATGTGAIYNTVASTKPWGEESDGSFVQPWDCTQPKLVNQHPTAALWVNVSRPGPHGVSTTGSIAGTMNATGAGFDECTPTPRNDGASHPGQILATVPYSTEGDVSNEIGPRNQTDQVLGFNEGIRPNPPGLGLVASVYQWAPSDPTRDLPTVAFSIPDGSDGFWLGTAVTAASRNPYTERDLHTPRGVSYVTFYAVVGLGATTSYSLILPGATGTYGVEACGTSTSGVHNGWDCDVTHWWKNLLGQDVMPKAGIIGGQTDVPVGALPGTAYNLRDVDCYDESNSVLRPLGVSQHLVRGATNPPSLPCEL